MCICKGQVDTARVYDGCTDINKLGYDPLACEDDGTCINYVRQPAAILTPQPPPPNPRPPTPNSHPTPPARPTRDARTPSCPVHCSARATRLPRRFSGA